MEAMRHFDPERKGSIQASDLKKVFKRLGLISVEEHIPLLLKAGGVH
jgi:Ca2+-binding EF-hand superfamily protein